MADGEITISELELTEELNEDMVLPVETSTDTKSTTLSAIQEWLKTFFVGLTGAETIEGQKTFTDSITQANSEASFNSLSMKDLGLEASTIPETLRKRIFALVDSLNQNIVEVNLIRDTSNVRATMRAINAIAGNEAILAVRADDNGTTYATAPASAQNGSIVVTSASSKSSNGYIKFGNGFIFQWGRRSATSSATITLPLAFTSTNYSVVTTSKGTNTSVYQVIVNTLTASNFKVQAGGGASSSDFNWVAMGY